MNEKIKQAKESLEKLIEDISIDSGYSYPALYADIRTALDVFDRYHESQQDLIEGKDEYIAKLCNDRAELKEHEKELIAEQHRLFDLAKEQETELKKLKEFVKAISSHTNINSLTIKGENEIEISYFSEKWHTKDFNLVKKVVEEYGK